MKYIISLCLFVLISSLTAEDKPPMFTVNGYGKIFYEVDIADVHFSVSVRNAQAQAAKIEHDQNIKKLQAYLEEQDYPAEILSLKGTILKREKVHSRTLKDDYYIAKSDFSLRTKRLADLSKLQADIVDLGVDEIQAVNLFSSKQRELESQARIKAIADAKRKAELTARELGWTLEKPSAITYISANSYYAKNTGFGMRYEGNRSSKSDVVTSANYVDATVNITFIYSP